MIKKFLNTVSPFNETFFFLLISIFLSVAIGLSIEFSLIEKDTEIHNLIVVAINFLISINFFLIETAILLIVAVVAYAKKEMVYFYLIGRKIAYSLFFLGLVPVMYSILMFWHPSIFTFTNSALTASVLTFVYGYLGLVFMQKIKQTQ